MLLRWKDTNKKASKNVLTQVIEKCRANKGIELLNYKYKMLHALDSKVKCNYAAW